jgi:chorismate mutase / prephenate dehydratase
VADLRVGYAGEGSYAEEAALALYPDAEAASLADFTAVARAVWDAEVDRAVLPLENSLAGLVPDTLTVLEEGWLSIVEETVLPIPHCLIGLPGAAAAEVRVVHSHPMALAQCRSLLANGFETVGARSTAEAARTVAARGDRTHAAVASPLAARTYGLEVLVEDVSDHGANYTRFVSLARYSRIDREAHPVWRSALRFVTPHEPGALHDAIEPFRYHRVQMTSLHSRPLIGEPWRYQFYADVEGHRADDPVARALADVERRTTFLEVLGSFPVTSELSPGT